MRTTALAAVLVLALAAAGCGGGDDEAAGPLPDGLQALETDLFRVGHPEGWSVETAPSPDGIEGATLTNVLSPKLPDGTQAEVVVVATPGYGSSLDAAVDLADEAAQTRNGRREVLARKDVDVPGAEGARRIDADTPRQDGVLVRTVNVLALAEDRTLVNLAIFVPGPELPDVPVEAIVDSLVVRG